MTVIDPSIACVLFDLDGTLVDTAADFQRVLDIMTEEENRPGVSAERVHETVSDGARALVRLAFGIDDSHVEFDARLQRLLDLYYDQLDRTESQPYPGIPELLDDLEFAGIPWGVVTNKPEKYSQRLLQRLGLLERCGTLVCPEHVTARKPDPEPILLACRQLGVKVERTVYIGDHERDMLAARNAEAIAVAALYGYLSADARVEEWRADFVIGSAAEAQHLLSILKFA